MKFKQKKLDIFFTLSKPVDTFSVILKHFK